MRPITVPPGSRRVTVPPSARCKSIGGLLPAIILTVEEGRVASRRRGLEDQAIDGGQGGREVFRGARRLAAQRGLQAGHHQGSGDPFTGDIADGNAEASLGQSKKVI